MTTRSRPSAPADTAGRTARYRPELQGLRALAVALVVVYHVWFNRVSGGVDVFFLVSGFLLTGQLVRAADRGPIALRPLWGRMATRLLPVALTVLLTTVVAAVLVLPEGRWLQTIREVVASALFLQNWRLATDAVDYAAQNNAASVVQHFWSLSIQGQVFVAWPLLVVLVVLVARRAGADLHGYLTLALVGIGVASLSYSAALTAADQPLAYFHTLTRLWEFAFGGLLALGIDRVSLSRGTRTVLGWTGAVGLLLCGFVLQVGSVFPGYAALWPTTCAALVIAAGVTGSRWGVDRLLVARPAQYLGGLSYALYLWHWPVLVLYLVGRGREAVGLRGGALVIGTSLVLAALTYHLIERPALRPAGPRPYRALAAGTVLVLLTAAGWQVAALQRITDIGRAGDSDHPGALALAGAVADPAVEPLPPMVSVYEDWVRLEHWDCAAMARLPREVCTQPVKHQPERRIVVVGDSHALQFAGALVPLAQQRGWQLISIVLGACPFSTASEVVPDDPDCLAWNGAAAAEIADLRPDGVVTLASRDVRTGLIEVTPPGFVEQWWRLHDLSIPVLAVRDNPRFDFSPPDCLQHLGRSAPGCGVERAAVYAPEPPWARLNVPPNVSFLDLSDQLCNAVHCPAEIGNVLVYMDDNHLSASYAATMAPAVERHVAITLGW
jgi:peptidoglycan/LPS O-acetylase OafA/YrhL